MSTEPEQSGTVADEPESATSIGPALSPRLSDEEVEARRRELAELEARIADRELLLTTCRSGLRYFESRYFRAIRPRFAELDRVEAEIAEAMAALHPENPDLAAYAAEMRERAEASARASDEVVAAEETSGCHTPSVGLKRLYRRVALNLHPDRGLDDDEIAHRHELMVEANRAYRDGDTGLLETLLRLYDAGESLDGTSGEARRVLWQLARAERRLGEIDAELAEIERSELFDLWRQSEVAADQGRDFIQEKVAEVARKLKKATARLDNLRAV